MLAADSRLTQAVTASPSGSTPLVVVSGPYRNEAGVSLFGSDNGIGERAGGNRLVLLCAPHGYPKGSPSVIVFAGGGFCDIENRATTRRNRSWARSPTP
jgi:hypothetical protein